MSNCEEAAERRELFLAALKWLKAITFELKKTKIMQTQP